MPPFGSLNYIKIGPRGTLEPSGSLHTSREDIDELIRYLSDPAQKKLTIHCHGGLVSEESGLTTARAMTTVYAAAGAHPVTFIWETGFLETVKDNLNTITQTELFKKLLALALKHAMKALGFTIPGKGPGQPMSLAEIQARLASGAPFEEFDAGARGVAAIHTEAELDEAFPEIREEVSEDVEADLAIGTLLIVEAPETPLFNHGAVAVSESEKGKGVVTATKLALALAKIVYRITKRYIRKHDHGFYPTVVEEILREFYLADLGQWVWGNMKEKADQMWLSCDGLAGNAIHGARYFLEQLCELQRRRDDLVIDLVGHSAGSIVICQMFRAAADANLPIKIRNVIFMAPACSSKLFLKEIVHVSGRFEKFRMFTMNDAFECKNFLVPLVYTRSLLYLISGALDGEDDEPVAGLDRFLQNQPPFGDPELQEIDAFLGAPGGDRLVLSKTPEDAPRGKRCTAERHQDFDENGPMQDSLIFLISQ
jgi:hypothetical protein